MQAIIELVILEVTLVKIAICQNGSLEEPDTSIEEASRKEVMGFRIYQETHRNSDHNQTDKNRIMTINQEDSFIITFFINSMVKLTEIVHKEVDHDDKV